MLSHFTCKPYEPMDVDVSDTPDGPAEPVVIAVRLLMSDGVAKASVNNHSKNSG